MVNNDNRVLEQDAEVVLSDELLASQLSTGKDQEFCFKDLYEQSLQNVQFGEIVTGKIVQITNDVAMVDVGWKTEGYIPIRELKDESGNISFSVADDIEVFIDRKDEDGNLVLSRNKAAQIRVWDDIKIACELNQPVKGIVKERVKGGLSVDVGVPAFLPGSQVDLRPVRDLDKFVGKTMLFNVLKYDRRRSNIVLSRRTILEQEREAEKKNTLENIQEGKIVEGVVKNITDYGIFVDLGGIDGLLHVTDISWGRITRPADHFTKGTKIKVIVLSFDREKERVSLGIKQLIENPWLTIAEKYPIGSIVEGTIVSIADYGAFVEIEPGVEGLIHVSEMFWTREIKHPSKFLTVGKKIKVMIIDINQENKRISLGLKQTTPNPWEAIKQKYPEGSIIRGAIRNITNFGIFVGVEEGIDGLIHVSDISWKQRVTNPAEHYSKDQEIEAMVLHVDVENEKFSLGLKQIEPNPWEQLSVKYSPGSSVSGKVTNITDFGMFVELEDGVEGLVHISELSNKRVKSTSELFSVGDTVTATIKNIDVKNKKIRLTLKDQETETEGHAANHYINNRESVGSNLGKALADVRILSADN
ncbi:MAG: 30S ribosomal protein S1 [Syntrophales bacterium LBB04]|nr:30S ribosomal protein S1 [Syntrophales bacterium LBB04]